MIREMSQLPPTNTNYNNCTSYLFPSAETSENIQFSKSLSQGEDDEGWHIPGSWEPVSEESRISMPVESTTSTATTKRRVRRSGKSSYKHVPHREKPPHLVARRNARERRRVQAVNTAFSRLRKCVPTENRNKRLSKVKTLHRAIEYIQTLQEMLDRADEELGTKVNPMDGPPPLLIGEPIDQDFEEGSRRDREANLNKENELHHRWIPLDDTNCDNDTHSSWLSFYDDFSDQLQS